MISSDISHLDDQPPGEEIAASITHGVGAGLAVAALCVLVALSALRGDAWRVVGFSIYGASLVTLYLSSMFYHAFRRPAVKHIFRIFDHAAIYLLIAGTYTPFLLVTLRGPLGWTLFGITWGIAAAGVVQAALALDRLKLAGLAVYVLLGWLIVVAWGPLAAAIREGGMAWLIAGGVFYTGGVVFYVTKRIPFNHAIWHLFVLAGSACHFVAMLRYVLPG